MGKAIIYTTEKTCRRCGENKDISLFYHNINSLDGHSSQCKTCLNTDHGAYVLRHKSILNEYNRNKAAIYRRANILRHHWKTIKLRGCKVTLEAFETWYREQGDICHYCGISRDILSIIDWPKYKIVLFTIDRKDNTRGYSLDNMCLCCRQCNVSKNSIFTEKEFIEIGKEYIRPKWEAKITS